ncbi:MAG: bifunctional alpha/beta hydrolase/OsmC family protein [Pseudomonadota bacterium]
MKQQRITFTNRSGETLAGQIDWPADEKVGYRAIALFAHCFTCTKNIKAAGNISRALTDHGIAVLRFDFTGLGESDGDFADTNFSSNVEDLIDAANWLAEQHAAPSLLVGHSLGGTAVLQAAPQIDSAVAVATIGSPSTPEHVTHLFSDKAADIERDGSAEVLLAGRPFTIKQQFIEDLHKQPLADTVAGMRKALLIMHSPIDTTVDVSNAAELFTQAKHPKSFVSLDTADHLLSNNADSSYAARVLAGWADRYLPDAEPGPGAAPGHTVAATRTGSFRTDINVAGHDIVADEPASVGGSNSGPTPTALLDAALASCTSMTIQMYARHKSLPLTKVSVDVTHNKEESDGETITVFHRNVTLEGDLTDAQRARMMEIADRCPVHRTLHSDVQVRSTLTSH